MSGVFKWCVQSNIFPDALIHLGQAQARLFQECNSDGYSPVYSLMICINNTITPVVYVC